MLRQHKGARSASRRVRLLVGSDSSRLIAAVSMRVSTNGWISASVPSSRNPAVEVSAIPPVPPLSHPLFEREPWNLLLALISLLKRQRFLRPSLPVKMPISRDSPQPRFTQIHLYLHFRNPPNWRRVALLESVGQTGLWLALSTNDGGLYPTSEG